jgi:hypothetical protein
MLKPSRPVFFPAFATGEFTSTPTPLVMQKPQFRPGSTPIDRQTLTFATAMTMHKKANVAPKAKQSRKRRIPLRRPTQSNPPKPPLKEKIAHAPPPTIASMLVVFTLQEKALAEIEEIGKANKEIVNHSDWNRCRM